MSKVSNIQHAIELIDTKIGKLQHRKRELEEQAARLSSKQGETLEPKEVKGIPADLGTAGNRVTSGGEGPYPKARVTLSDTKDQMRSDLNVWKASVGDDAYQCIIDTARALVRFERKEYQYDDVLSAVPRGLRKAALEANPMPPRLFRALMAGILKGA